MKVFEVLEQNNQTISFNSQNIKNPLYYVLFHSCIYYKFPLQTHTNLNNFLLTKAYQEKLLNLEESYFAIPVTESLTQSIHCFFLPQSSLPKTAKMAILDILLPTCIALPRLCALFIGEQNSLFCFYQDQKLLFCKPIKDLQTELQPCLELIQSCFDYQCQTLYSLNYQHSQHQLYKLQSIYPTQPLFCVFDSTIQGFSFPSCTLHLPIQSPPNFIPPKPKPHATQSFLKLLAPCIALPCIVWFILFLYQSYLTSSIQRLEKNSSMHLTAQTLQQLQHSNHSLALALYPLSKTSPLDTLNSILPLFNPHPIQTITFQAPKTFSITLQNPINPAPLLAKLNSYGYKTTVKHEEMTFYIEIDDD